MSYLPKVIAAALLVAFIIVSAVVAQDARIIVHADRPGRRISPYLTGACIEDVNHEVYGGIYSQMIFGESFQEPLPQAVLKGFTAHGGRWTLGRDELRFQGTPGDKLVSQSPAFAEGEVGVEVFADRDSTNAGLIVRVEKPAAGMDNFDGYEIALNAAQQMVRLGRHRHDWELIKDVPCELPVGQWVALSVELKGSAIEVFVGGKSVLLHDDGNSAIRSGGVGLRAFYPEARYRKFWVKTGNETNNLGFKSGNEPIQEVSGMWRVVARGDATGAFSLDKHRPFVGGQSQRITFTAGNGEIGVENQGLNRWGMYFERGKPYEGVLWVRAEKLAEVFVSLESKDGTQVAARQSLLVKEGDWRRLTFTLEPKVAVPVGRFAVTLAKPGSVVLGYASLQPGEWGRFKGLPDRRDVTEGLIDQGITVLRYGGSMINHPEYRWKKMIGPRDQRPPHKNTWYPYASNGWGILDFLNLCEAAGFLGIPAVNMDETPQDMVDFMEYVNGPADSVWGRKRAEDGHPQPHHLRYLQLGNEERVEEIYFKRFKALAEAIWAKDPNIILVVGDFCYGEQIVDPFHFGGAAGCSSLAAHQKILQLAKRHDREVWFDVHVGTEGPCPDSSLDGMFSFRDALHKLADGAKHRVVVFELNAGNHSQKRALANAIAIQAAQRDGGLPIVTSANCLQPDRQNDNDWDQGLLFLNPSQVWLQPPGYVTRMISRNYQPLFAPTEVADSKNQLDVSAARSEDGKVMVMQVVSVGNEPQSAVIRLDGFTPSKPTAAVEELSGPLDAVNTAEDPKHITPKTEEWRHGFAGNQVKREFAPNSFTVIRFE